jgi:hypothetical protein
VVRLDIADELVGIDIRPELLEQQSPPTVDETASIGSGRWSLRRYWSPRPCDFGHCCRQRGALDSPSDFCLVVSAAAGIDLRSVARHGERRTDGGLAPLWQPSCWHLIVQARVIQDGADAGHQPWLLLPELVSTSFAAAQYGLADPVSRQVGPAAYEVGARYRSGWPPCTWSDPSARAPEASGSSPGPPTPQEATR